MLNRRGLLKVSAAGMLVAASGLPAMADAGHLEGESYFCLYDILEGRVDIHDVAKVTITRTGRYVLNMMQDVVDYTERKKLPQSSSHQGLVAIARQLHETDRLIVGDDYDAYEVPLGLWTRQGMAVFSYEPDETLLQKFYVLLSSEAMQARAC